MKIQVFYSFKFVFEIKLIRVTVVSSILLKIICVLCYSPENNVLYDYTMQYKLYKPL